LFCIHCELNPWWNSSMSNFACLYSVRLWLSNPRGALFIFVCIAFKKGRNASRDEYISGEISGRAYVYGRILNSLLHFIKSFSTMSNPEQGELTMMTTCCLRSFCFCCGSDTDLIFVFLKGTSRSWYMSKIDPFLHKQKLDSIVMSIRSIGFGTCLDLFAADRRNLLGGGLCSFLGLT
jgi:hypothetical protein